MSKMVTYTIMMFGLVALFYFTGLTTDCKDGDGNQCTEGTGCTCESTMLKVILTPSEWETSSLFTKTVIAIGGLGSLIGLGAAFALRDVRLGLMAPIATFLFLLLWDFIKVISKIYSVHPLLSVLVSLIFAPFFIYYALAVSEWWSTGS